MNLKQLFEEDDAVSPVIGVILMVAITVILAAVIGTFVLGLGDQVQETAPTAQLETETGTTGVDNDGANSVSNDFTSVTVSHEGGDGLSGDNVNVTVNGNLALGTDGGGGASSADQATALWGSGTDISAGSSVTVVAAADYSDSANLNAYSGTGSQLDVDIGGSVISDVGISDGDTVRVVWKSSEGGRSSTLMEEEV